jgi:hypothetical protein
MVEYFRPEPRLAELRSSSMEREPGSVDISSSRGSGTWEAAAAPPDVRWDSASPARWLFSSSRRLRSLRDRGSAARCAVGLRLTAPGLLSSSRGCAAQDRKA